jgi:hypothetical protein
MRQSNRRPLFAAASAVFAALGLVAVAGCGSSSPAGSATSPAATSPAASSPTTPGGASPTVAANCGSANWQSAPVSVVRQVPVPPVPVVTAVRTGSHPECGYDRLVVDLSGPLPGYTIRYVSTVIADPSGKTVTIPGQRYLLIILNEAQAHTAAGAPTVSRLVHVPGYPVLTSWALAGDFEGVVRLAVGLSGTASIRVGELPGRLYIDFKS